MSSHPSSRRWSPLTLILILLVLLPTVLSQSLKTLKRYSACISPCFDRCDPDYDASCVCAQLTLRGDSSVSSTFTCMANLCGEGFVASIFPAFGAECSVFLKKPISFNGTVIPTGSATPTPTGTRLGPVTETSIRVPVLTPTSSTTSITDLNRPTHASTPPSAPPTPTPITTSRPTSTPNLTPAPVTSATPLPKPILAIAIIVPILIVLLIAVLLLLYRRRRHGRRRSIASFTNSSHPSISHPLPLPSGPSPFYPRPLPQLSRSPFPAPEFPAPVHRTLIRAVEEPPPDHYSQQEQQQHMQMQEPKRQRSVAAMSELSWMSGRGLGILDPGDELRRAYQDVRKGLRTESVSSTEWSPIRGGRGSRGESYSDVSSRSW